MSFSFANGLFWTSVACCAVAQLFIIRSVLGSRPLPETAAALPRQRGAIELFWTIVPAIALAALLVATWHAVEERAGRATGRTAVEAPRR